MVAGGIKVRLAARRDVRVGLPLALKGRVFPSNSSRSVHGLMRMDDHEVWLVITGTHLR